MLSQGVCCGIGFGLCFPSALTVMSTYFSTRRSLALGIGAAGSSVGGLIFPSVVRQLLPKIGFGWTVRVIGFLVLAMLVVCNLGLRTRLPPRRTGPLVELSAFKEAPYSLFTLGMVFLFFALYVYFFYITTFATTIIGMSPADAAIALLVMNGIGVPARVGASYVADRFTGPLNILIPTGFVSALVLYLFETVRTTGQLYAIAVFYGIASAFIQALFPGTLASLTTDPQRAGIRLGMVFSCVSVAALVGAPIGGALITASDGKFLAVNMYAGSCMLVGSVILVLARLSKSGLRWRYRM
jgi:predicted MFS family arabinose efflux permease